MQPKLSTIIRAVAVKQGLPVSGLKTVVKLALDVVEEMLYAGNVVELDDLLMLIPEHADPQNPVGELLFRMQDVTITVKKSRMLTQRWKFRQEQRGITWTNLESIQEPSLPRKKWKKEQTQAAPSVGVKELSSTECSHADDVVPSPSKTTPTRPKRVRRKLRNKWY